MRAKATILTGLATAAASVPAAQAGYVASLEAIDGSGTLTVNPFDGGEVRFRLRLDGSPSDKFDAAVFRLVFGAEGLGFGPGWASWAGPFLTAGGDDFSSPRNDASGVVDAATYADPNDPAAVDLYLENITPAFGQTFGSGVLVDFFFTINASYAGPLSFTIGVAPDTFSDGTTVRPVVAGSPLSVLVVPSSATASTLALASVLTRRRR